MFVRNSVVVVALVTADHWEEEDLNGMIFLLRGNMSEEQESDVSLQTDDCHHNH